MAVKLFWLEPDRILMGEYTGTATGDDLALAMEESLKACDLMPTGILVDVSHIEGFETSFVNMPSALKLVRHPNMAGLAMVGNNGLIRFAAQMLMVGARMKICTSRAEAVAFLKGKLEAQSVH
jgi:hypothetical protein